MNPGHRPGAHPPGATGGGTRTLRPDPGDRAPVEPLYAGRRGLIAWRSWCSPRYSPPGTAPSCPSGNLIELLRSRHLVLHRRLCLHGWSWSAAGLDFSIGRGSNALRRGPSTGLLMDARHPLGRWRCSVGLAVGVGHRARPTPAISIYLGVPPDDRQRSGTFFRRRAASPVVHHRRHRRLPAFPNALSSAIGAGKSAAHPYLIFYARDHRGSSSTLSWKGPVFRLQHQKPTGGQPRLRAAAQRHPGGSASDMGAVRDQPAAGLRTGRHIPRPPRVLSTASSLGRAAPL